MLRNIRLGPSLAFLVLAALTGLVGFYIVYHYASTERPIERFAVVIDAGSTQTRSNLYSISLSPGGAATDLLPEEQSLSDIIQVRELDRCVNGGPLAAISSSNDANRLLQKCLPKFARKIRRLDFLASAEINDVVDEIDESSEGRQLDADELDKQMALLSHRVNSVTHVHLGATAGMRALALLEPHKAGQKVHWIQEAIGRNNANQLAGTIFMNPGFVGIIEGTSEASFGWLSVNFVCNRLHIDAQTDHDLFYHQDNDNQQQNQTAESTTNYSVSTGDNDNNGEWSIVSQVATTVVQPSVANIATVGTLELGGASTQMAFQVAASSSGATYTQGDLQTDSLELFGKKYPLATRSDLCLGMSQTILRANYLLLRQHYDTRRVSPPVNQLTPVEIVNPCQQNGSRLSLTKELVDAILNGACLEESRRGADVDNFKQFIVMMWTQQQAAPVPRLQVIGTGEVSKCDRLLANLLEPEECKKVFSLCPANKNKQKPPTRMPFVTISGYNKVLQVLNLSRGKSAPQTSSPELDQVIGAKLGGHPIDFGELEQKMLSFCSLDVKEFPRRFPEMNKKFYNVNCLQMVYIKKLLVEFYQFDPLSSWNQIRFLLFPVPEEPLTDDNTAPGTYKRNADIGWTLGLLLNATSYELATESKPHDVIFHHGATIEFIIRTTIFLMFACVLISASIIVFSLVLAKRKFRSAYDCHSAVRDGGPQGSPPNSL